MAAVIFDFDGTIADSFEYVAGYLMKQSGHKNPKAEDMEHLRGLSMLAMARTLGISWLKLPKVFVNGREDMAKSLSAVEPFEGMKDVIKKVHAEGHELFILSSNRVSTLHKFLHKQDLHTYFLELYGGVSIFGKAPALKRLLKENNLDVKDCVYIGDELRDVNASQSVKMRIIAVTWGFARTSDLAAKKPTALVSTRKELLSALEEI